MTKRKAKPVRKKEYSYILPMAAVVSFLWVPFVILSIRQQDGLNSYAQAETSLVRKQLDFWRTKSYEAKDRWDEFTRRKATRAPGGRVRVEGYILVHSTVETTGLRYYDDLSGRRWVTRE